MGNDEVFKSDLSESTYISQLLTLASSKIYSQYCHKLVWKKYYSKAIDLSTARSIACKINSSQLGNESYLKNIYGKLGLAATGIDLFVDCLKIAKNNKMSDKKKEQEITKKVAGTVTATVVGIKTAKYVAKVIKILRSSNGLTVIGGFALDCFLSYSIGKTTDDVTEILIQKIFDLIE